MDGEENYERVRAVFLKGKFRMIKEDRPKAFKFGWTGKPIDIWNAKHHIFEKKDMEKYTADSEGYVRFKHEPGHSSVEWDVRPSRKLKRSFEKSIKRYTFWTACASTIVVAIGIALFVLPSLLHDIGHGVGTLAIAAMFLWIPPMTVYTILEYIRSSLAELGAQNVGKRIEKMLKDRSKELENITTKRYEEP